jgi:YhcH/YjgK/YiaL family protein
MIFDTIRTLNCYRGIHPNLDDALDLIQSSDSLFFPEGRTIIDNGRLIQIGEAYTTRRPEQIRWEAHRKYLDIQMIIDGAERMDWAPLDTMDIIEPYDAERDVMSLRGHGQSFVVSSGHAVIFFPHDAHAPSRADVIPGPVRKSVVKVLVGH